MQDPAYPAVQEIIVTTNFGSTTAVFKYLPASISAFLKHFDLVKFSFLFEKCKLLRQNNNQLIVITMKLTDLIFDLLDISRDVPLSEVDMAEDLKVTFQPPHKRNKRLDLFAEKLKKVFTEIGVQIIPYEDALIDGDREKVESGIVIIEQGMGKDEDLAIKKVSSLYHNPVVALFDSPPPIPENPTLQETLDSIIGVLAWNLSHVPIFIEDDQWTICTMNGAVIECSDWTDPKDDILHSLIPKLSAQVVPPKREEIVYREDVFNAIEMGYEDYINDFMGAAEVWRDNGLMLAHTSIEDLEYRNRFYKRIVSQYLDHRTGMSYGFMVKQLPVELEPAVEKHATNGSLAEHDWAEQPLLEYNNKFYACIEKFGKKWIVAIPDVWLLSTRSGCNKTDLDPMRDILRLGLNDGKITIDVPPESDAQECRPSYDTFAILAHATGNIITASILLSLDPKAVFPDILQRNGLSISHWHGYPDKSYPISGYAIHGDENPPVSCSTPQSAAYAFRGKFKALSSYQDSLSTYRGDIHIEPHHGTNITGTKTLTETAEWVDEMHKHQVETGELKA